MNSAYGLESHPMLIRLKFKQEGLKTIYINLENYIFVESLIECLQLSSRNSTTDRHDPEVVEESFRLTLYFQVHFEFLDVQKLLEFEVTNGLYEFFVFFSFTSSLLLVKQIFFFLIFPSL
jgi:hypothetical protein